MRGAVPAFSLVHSTHPTSRGGSPSFMHVSPALVPIPTQGRGFPARPALRTLVSTRHLGPVALYLSSCLAFLCLPLHFCYSSLAFPCFPFFYTPSVFRVVKTMQCRGLAITNYFQYTLTKLLPHKELCHHIIICRRYDARTYYLTRIMSRHNSMSRE